MQERTRTAPPANPHGVGTGGAFNYGSYLRAWKAAGDYGQLKGSNEDAAVLFNNSKYAGVIELGRRIGKLPPLKMIARWAQRRLALSPKDAQRAAWPIAHAIKKRGLAGRHVMGGAIPTLGQFFLEEMVHSLDIALRRAASR
jgi:hypothetical protein